MQVIKILMFLRQLWENCGKKGDFTIKQCECADGKFWEHPKDENNEGFYNIKYINCII